jgi:hypothetical protein
MEEEARPLPLGVEVDENADLLAFELAEASRGLDAASQRLDASSRRVTSMVGILIRDRRSSDEVAGPSDRDRSAGGSSKHSSRALHG